MVDDTPLLRPAKASAHDGSSIPRLLTSRVAVNMSEIREAVHRDPVWRDRSNFIIAASIEPGDTTISTEQLWARRLDDLHYELCCIPFFAYDLALGDVVEVDSSFLVVQVSERSGRYVFRVHLDQAAAPRDEILEELADLGALVEWSSAKLLAVDARDQPLAQKIADSLQDRENLGQLIFETGKSA